jgi:ankyrin repeat protein
VACQLSASVETVGKYIHIRQHSISNQADSTCCTICAARQQRLRPWDLTNQLSIANFTFEVILFALCVAMAEAARLLETAFRNGDCKAIRLYIKRGYNCSAVDPTTQFTLLHLVTRLRCADCDKRSMAENLIRGGNPVDTRDKDGLTPLMRCESFELAKVLLDHGADFNACSGNLPVVQLLLSRGASVNAKDWRSKTALFLACEKSYCTIAETLLAAGASATNQLLLHAVLRGKHSADAKLELLRLLLQHGADVNELDADGVTPLIQCVNSGAGCRAASLLLEAGADVSAAQTGGGDSSAQMTALHYAAYVSSSDTIDMLKLLLAARASANLQCSIGYLPLHNALKDSECSKSQVRPVQSLFIFALLLT